MLFNSADYVLFLPLVLLVYLVLRRAGLRAQNAWLLVALALSRTAVRHDTQ
jgi:hypothetical protein